MENSVITLTFGDMAENHVGMEQIGKIVEEGEGFNLNDLKQIKNTFKTNKPKIYKLHQLNKELKELNLPEAYVLIIPNGIETILNQESEYTLENLSAEQTKLNWDVKAFMYGRVVNKSARYNLCFDKKGHTPDYENGKGRVISYNKIPVTKVLIDNMEKYFGAKGKNLKGEGNYYYDKTKCGIGYHGDSERRKVIAFRIGSNLDIHYQWFIDGNAIGPNIQLPLNGGDIYVMSEKAVGTDWKKKTIYTLRHSTGNDKFTKLT